MSNDTKTNDFIRDCVVMAARFYNMEPASHEAAATLVNIARMAAESPQETAPIHHYVPVISEALRMGYGEMFELADLSNGKQEEAVRAWVWFEEVAHKSAAGSLLWAGRGEALAFARAIAAFKRRGEGWRSEMKSALVAAKTCYERVIQ